MDRRLFLTGLLGVAGTAAFAAAMPHKAEALTGDPLEDLRPPRLDGMPSQDVAETPIEEGEQYAVGKGSGNRPNRERYRYPYGRGHGGRGRRRRRRRRWNRECFWRYGRRICRRRAVWVWGFF
jgi:hypothetical protein